MMLEMLAATLLGLGIAAFLVGPLLQRSRPSPVTSEDPEDPEETRKGMALAALREIEFDRATGKLSDEDYQDLKARYSARALAVLREEDASAGSAGGAAATHLDPVEAMIADRVKAMQGPATRCPVCGPRPESDALFCSSCGGSLATGGCSACGSPLVPGSRFCEECGLAVAS
jgi:predicted nucleic acid-binding Zn ribbon protein